jgi:hypothetical protein
MMSIFKQVSERRKLAQMSFPELEAKLDAEVSFYVRAKAVQAAQSAFIPCYTCGRVRLWKEMDAGHYVSRVKRGTRWDLRNIRVQDTVCNRYAEGEKDVFRRKLVEEVGEVEVERVEFQATFFGPSKHSREYLLLEIKRYRGLNSSLRKEIANWL